MRRATILPPTCSAGNIILTTNLLRLSNQNYLSQFDVRIDILILSCQRSTQDKLSSKKDCNFVLTGERRGDGKTSLV